MVGERLRSFCCCCCCCFSSHPLSRHFHRVSGSDRFAARHLFPSSSGNPLARPGKFLASPPLFPTEGPNKRLAICGASRENRLETGICDDSDSRDETPRDGSRVKSGPLSHSGAEATRHEFHSQETQSKIIFLSLFMSPSASLCSLPGSVKHGCSAGEPSESV